MKLAIYGAGGLGREIYDVAARVNAVSHRWAEIFFLDDFSKASILGVRRIGLSDLGEDEVEAVVAVGEPKTRELLCNKLSQSGVSLTSFVDPLALVSPGASLSPGVIVCEFATVHTGVSVSENVLIQPYCDIGHDISIGKHSVMSPFCAPGGGARFGDRVFMGMRSCCVEGTAVGDDAIVGMGSAVFRDVPAGATVLGNPARATKPDGSGKVFKDHQR